MTTPDLLAAERFYDGAIPQHLLDALKHGSPLDRDISQAEQEITFYKNMLTRAVFAGKRWKLMGNTKMAEENRRSAISYLQSWRNRRHQLAELLKIENMGKKS